MDGLTFTKLDSIFSLCGNQGRLRSCHPVGGTASGRLATGAYRVRRTLSPQVTIAAMGAILPEALAAAERLDAVDIHADFICVTSPGLLFQSQLARRGRADTPTWILDQVFPASRATPLVTVLDGHPHTVAFLATINQVPSINLGVTRFGQSGSSRDVYQYHGIDTDSIVRAWFDLVST